jgi:hypothetical protein
MHVGSVTDISEYFEQLTPKGQRVLLILTVCFFVFFQQTDTLFH